MSTDLVINIATETGAAWVYTAFPMTSSCELNGKIIGVGTAGVYVVDNSTDDDVEIIWQIKTGLMDFGKYMLKRMDSIDVVGDFVEKPICKFAVVSGDDKQEWWFSVPIQTHDLEDHVVLIGKGIKYYYAQVLLHGEGAATLEKLNLYPVVLDRRR